MAPFHPLPFTIVAILAVGLAASGCSSFSSSPTPSSSTPAPGRIAIEGPMTGPQSATGADMYRGAQLAADQINAAGGVDGVKLQLVRADDAALPGTGVTVAKHMVQQGVFGVVGPFNSGVGVDNPVSYNHFRAHGTRNDIVCRL